MERGGLMFIFGFILFALYSVFIFWLGKGYGIETLKQIIKQRLDKRNYYKAIFDVDLDVPKHYKVSKGGQILAKDNV